MWSRAVRSDSTLIVLHSGHCEYIGIRHRASQTLFLSDPIDPTTCKDPAYGKLQIGLYLYAIKDAMARYELRTNGVLPTPAPIQKDDPSNAAPGSTLRKDTRQKRTPKVDTTPFTKVRRLGYQ